MNREEVVIITKCGVTWDQEMKGDLFNKVNGIQLYKNLNSESVKKEIVGSLSVSEQIMWMCIRHIASLGRIEYYVPIQKTMDVLNEFKSLGKDTCDRSGKRRYRPDQRIFEMGDSNIVQAKYSILDRGIEDEIIPCCRKNGVTIQHTLRLRWDFFRERCREIISRSEHRFRKNGSSRIICRRQWI